MRWEKSIKVTPMTGTGLIATPIPKPMTGTMASPVSRAIQERAARDRANRSLARPGQKSSRASLHQAGGMGCGSSTGLV